MNQPGSVPGILLVENVALSQRHSFVLMEFEAIWEVVMVDLAQHIDP